MSFREVWRWRMYFYLDLGGLCFDDAKPTVLNTTIDNALDQLNYNHSKHHNVSVAFRREVNADLCCPGVNAKVTYTRFDCQMFL